MNLEDSIKIYKGISDLTMSPIALCGRASLIRYGYVKDGRCKDIDLSIFGGPRDASELIRIFINILKAKSKNVISARRVRSKYDDDGEPEDDEKYGIEIYVPTSQSDHKLKPYTWDASGRTPYPHVDGIIGNVDITWIDPASYTTQSMYENILIGKSKLSDFFDAPPKTEESLDYRKEAIKNQEIIHTVAVNDMAAMFRHDMFKYKMDSFSIDIFRQNLADVSKGAIVDKELGVLWGNPIDALTAKVCYCLNPSTGMESRKKHFQDLVESSNKQVISSINDDKILEMISKLINENPN